MIIERIRDLEFIDHRGRSLYVEGDISASWAPKYFHILSVHQMNDEDNIKIDDYNEKEVEAAFFNRYETEIREKMPRNDK